MLSQWPFNVIEQFLATGGWVVWLILANCLLLLTLIFERYWYAYFSYPELKNSIQKQWSERLETHSWCAQRIRQLLLADAQGKLSERQSYIKMLVFICPLLGLLGTVSGMIEVFDVLAITGTGNARAMASGISKATVPTMSGMVVAIVGLFLSAQLEHIIKTKNQELAVLLPFEPRAKIKE